jgi:hypothetical protein
MRAQHGHVVGDGLGVGRADADVDHGDAAAVGPHQVVGRHLWQARRRRAQVVTRLHGAAHPARDDVAGLDKGFVVAVGVGHLRVAEPDEFVDVELVVGEEHEVLEVLGRCAGVVAQAVQRIVHARRGEQTQRLGFAGMRLVRAVGNAVVHGCQVGQVEQVAHQQPALVRHVAFEVVVFGQRKVHRDRLRAGAHLDGHVVVAQQQPELLQVVVGKEVRPRQRGLEAARAGHKAVAQA